MKKNRKKCYIYTRVSTAAQVDGFSLEAQQERLHEYADFRDLEIAGEYCDAGRSGKSIKGRPEFQKMMDDIVSQKDTISYVLVFKLSRFGRNAADVLKSMQLLNDFGVDLVSVDDAIDSSTQGGRLTLAILSAVAEIERENITDQFVSGRLQKLRDGKWAAGQVPYGYRLVNKEMVKDSYEADIVRKIFDLYLKDGFQATTVAQYLNENGYRKKKKLEDNQRPFTYDFIVFVLDNPVYCGKLVYGRRTNKKGPDGKYLKPDPSKQVTVTGLHEPILTEEEWNAVQEKRKKFSGMSRKVDDPERISLLSGLVKCPVCGRGMVHIKNKTINKNHGGYYKILHYYVCTGSRKQNGRVCSFRHSYNQEKIDSAVFEIVKDVGITPELKTAVMKISQSQESVDDLEAELKGKRKELRQTEMINRKWGETLDGLDVLDDGYEETFDKIQAKMDAGYDRMSEIEDQIDAITQKIEKIKKGYRASENISRMLDNFQKLYDHMSCKEKRDMYRQFIERIDVLPETRKDGKLLKSISFRFALSYGEDEITPEGNREDDICFTLDCTKLGLTRAEAKATYAEIKRYVLENFDLKVSSLYIAQIKRKYGIEIGTNYNKAADPNTRVPRCPEEKEKAIMEALKHFRMLEPSVEMIPNDGKENTNGKER